MGRDVGLTSAEITAILRDDEDHPWSAHDRDVLALADQMTTTPPDVDGALVARLVEAIGEAGVAGLTAAIAFENYRSRFNRALDVPAQGYDRDAGAAA